MEGLLRNIRREPGIKGIVIQIKLNKFEMEKIARVMNKLNMTHLKIIRIIDIPFSVKTAQHIANLIARNKLETIEFSNCGINNLSIIRLIMGLVQCKTLKVLSLPNNHIDDTHVQILSDSIVHLPNLVTLKLTNNPILTNQIAIYKCTQLVNVYMDKIKIADESARKCLFSYIESDKCSIRTLSLKECFDDTEWSKTLAEAMMSNKSVVQMDVSNNKVDSDNIFLIALMLGTNTTIKKLIICSAGIREFQAIQMINALEVNHTLNVLCLDNNTIGMSASKRLASLLKRSQSIVGIGLKQCKEVDTEELLIAIDDSKVLKNVSIGGEAFFKPEGYLFSGMYAHFRHITSLDISNSNLDTCHITMLGISLATNYGITFLNMNSCNLKDLCLDPFVSGLSHNASLKELYMRNCYIKPTETAKLFKVFMHHYAIRAIDLTDSPISSQNKDPLLHMIACNFGIERILLGNNFSDDFEFRDLEKVISKNTRLVEFSPMTAKTQKATLRNITLLSFIN